MGSGHSFAKLVVLKKGCWIGANVIILIGVIVGCNSVVGAGGVVTKSIPDGVVAELCYKLNRRYFGEQLFNRLIIASIQTYWQSSG